MHYEIETVRDLQQVFPSEMENFSDAAANNILAYLLDAFPDSAITEDYINAFREHDTLAALADWHGLDYWEAVEFAYEMDATEDDFPEYGEDGTPTGYAKDWETLTETEKAKAADEYSCTVFDQLEREAEDEGITIFNLPLSYLSWNPNR